MSGFQSLLDQTRFELVRWKVNRPCSPITDVLFVSGDELMCEMAEVLVRPVTHARRQRLQRWFEEGCIVVGTTGAVADPGVTGAHRIDLHRLDGEARCEVLYLPPCYLVHLPRAFAAGRGSV